MNNLLELKGNFDQRKRAGRPGARNLPNIDSIITLEHLNTLLNELIKIKNFWDNNIILDKCLFSVYYDDIIAKSNRMQTLFSDSKHNVNSTVVGAKYHIEGNKYKHIITHCVTREVLQETIDTLDISINLCKNLFGNIIRGLDIDKINKNQIDIPDHIKKTKFVGLIVDCYHIEHFKIEENVDTSNDSVIISLFDTGQDIKEIFDKIGIKNFLTTRQIDNTTVFLYPSEYEILRNSAPYLISMRVSDMSRLTISDFQFVNSAKRYIPKPTNEPTVGVIDTIFDEKSYLSSWVENHDIINKKNFDIKDEDYFHGTTVSSIIVDGPSLNPNLDDKCGRFKVRHFGVMLAGEFSSFTIVKSIEKIINENKDIKVWNLSLGSALEINQNFISPEAAILDKLQYENDIVFIISGTNKKESDKAHYRIGAPADSINSLIVNAVDDNGNPTSYTREGIVLSFFNKPDISYYGGTKENPLLSNTSKGDQFVYGTSYAAPWITRKMAYLIYKVGLSREIAKALIIDSTIGWKNNPNNSIVTGFGVVPIKIDDIITAKEDEIKFVMQGVSELYDTFSYRIPVPINQEKQPYIAKATLCYFPKCNRNQGVDYTNTEMDLHFGRVDPENNRIITINDNKQNEEISNYLKEENARKMFRKWDNVKHVRENFKLKGKPKKIYGNGLWGLSIKTIERLSGNDGKGVRFGLVITLKEINGINRINEFIQMCSLRGWLVNTIDIENRLNIYNKAENIIEFED